MYFAVISPYIYKHKSSNSSSKSSKQICPVAFEELKRFSAGMVEYMEQMRYHQRNIDKHNELQERFIRRQIQIHQNPEDVVLQEIDVRYAPINNFQGKVVQSPDFVADNSVDYPFLNEARYEFTPSGFFRNLQMKQNQSSAFPRPSQDKNRQKMMMMTFDDVDSGVDGLSSGQSTPPGLQTSSLIPNPFYVGPN